MASKIFVGRINEDMGADVLREYFEEFGEVNDIFIPKPFRSFAFVTFKDANVAQSICGGEHVIRDVHVRVNSAAPRVDYTAQRLQNIRSTNGSRPADYSNGRSSGFGDGPQTGSWSAPSTQCSNNSVGQLNPMAVAAALNQAGLGGLLRSSFQGVGAPPPVPPPSGPPPSTNYGGWSSGTSSSNSLQRPPPSHSGSYKSSNWS